MTNTTTLAQTVREKTVRLTMAQAVIKYLKNQYVERDGEEMPFFAGCFGIFGHGNVAGLGEALQTNPDFTYYQCRNEQAMVHTAAAFAKAKNRMQTFVCTTSVGPGATNMITAAAGATINRLPVLLLPGDIFATRMVAPVLQQLESEHSQDISVNDCFKPVSRYWDRINRPEQLITSLPEAMRVLTSPVDTGAVTLALPQDVQAEAYEFPAVFFEKRVWRIARHRADKETLTQAIGWIQKAKRPMIIAGGGVHYSDATDMLSAFCNQTGIPIGETQAGKGSLNFDHACNLGAVGATGTPGANITAREADLIIGVGTRYSDFTTGSKTAFQNPNVRFININVADFDSYKHSALPLTGDAKAVLEELSIELAKQNYATDATYQKRVALMKQEWEDTTDSIYSKDHPSTNPEKILSQGEVLGVLNTNSNPQDVVVCAAGSLPGDLHKLWRTRDSKGYHLEYGNSCMGYEIAGGLGVKMADPSREVYVMVGDGSYLMMAQEITTSVQEGIKLTIVLLDNNGYASIGGLSKAIGSDGFGTKYRYRNDNENQLTGDVLPVNFADNARSLGAHVIEANTRDGFASALEDAKQQTQTTVIVVPVDRRERVGGFESWWDVPIAEVSERSETQAARQDYETAKENEVMYYPHHKSNKTNIKTVTPSSVSGRSHLV